MTIEEIVVALENLDFATLSDEDLSNLAKVLQSSHSKASREAYFRARSSRDPDIMAAAD